MSNVESPGRIPQILHHIWIQGIAQAPTEVHQNLKNLHYLNPNWNQWIWDETKILSLLTKYPLILKFYQNLDQLPKSSDNIKVQASKSDIARWAIVYEYGGCYADVDVTCVGSLDEIVAKIPYNPQRKNTFASGNFWSSWSGQFFMSTPKHQVLETTLQNALMSTDRKMLGYAMNLAVKNLYKKNKAEIIPLKNEDVSMFHCGVASTCMVPIKVGSSSGAWSRRIYQFYCQYNSIFGFLLLLALVLLTLIIWKIKNYIYRIKFSTCVETNNEVTCKLR